MRRLATLHFVFSETSRLAITPHLQSAYGRPLVTYYVRPPPACYARPLAACYCAPSCYLLLHTFLPLLQPAAYTPSCYLLRAPSWNLLLCALLLPATRPAATYCTPSCNLLPTHPWIWGTLHAHICTHTWSCTYTHINTHMHSNVNWFTCIHVCIHPHKHTW